MGIEGSNGDVRFSTMKTIAESMLKNSGIKKPTSAQIIQKMVELAREESSTKFGEDLPIGFTLYRTSGQTEAPTDPPTDTPTQAPVYDVPTPPDPEPVTEPPTDPPVPTEAPTDPVTQAPVYDVPTPPDPEPVTEPPTDPPVKVGNTKTSASSSNNSRKKSMNAGDSIPDGCDVYDLNGQKVQGGFIKKSGLYIIKPKK